MNLAYYNWLYIMTFIQNYIWVSVKTIDVSLQIIEALNIKANSYGCCYM